MVDTVALINKFGFPVVAAIGMGFIIYYVWGWATKQIKPVIKNTNITLITLIDRIRTLDNDIIRLNEKVDVVLRLREQALEDAVIRDKKLQKTITRNNSH